MENLKLIDKLKNETNISYEDAKIALEQSSWDILDAVLYLEENEKIKKPSVSIFYTNENKEKYKYDEIVKSGDKYNNSKKDNAFEGVFVKMCKIIDTCNNIFFHISKENKTFLKIPVTVIILLLMFSFWLVIPLYIVGLFFEFEFSLSGKKLEINKINNVLRIASEKVKKIKRKIKKGFRND